MMSMRDGILVAIVAAFLAGMLQTGRQATATIPNACPKYECKNIYSWWGDGSNQVLAAYQVNSTNTTTYGYADIFATTSTDQNSGTTTGYYDK